MPCRCLEHHDFLIKSEYNSQRSQRLKQSVWKLSILVKDKFILCSREIKCISAHLDVKHKHFDRTASSIPLIFLHLPIEWRIFDWIMHSKLKLTLWNVVFLSGQNSSWNIFFFVQLLQHHSILTNEWNEDTISHFTLKLTDFPSEKKKKKIDNKFVYFFQL